MHQAGACTKGEVDYPRVLKKVPGATEENAHYEVFSEIHGPSAGIPYVESWLPNEDVKYPTYKPSGAQCYRSDRLYDEKNNSTA